MSFKTLKNHSRGGGEWGQAGGASRSFLVLQLGSGSGFLQFPGRPEDKAVCVLAVMGVEVVGGPCTILHLGGPDLGVRITAKEALTVEQFLLRQPVLKSPEEALGNPGPCSS